MRRGGRQTEFGNSYNRERCLAPCLTANTGSHAMRRAPTRFVMHPREEYGNGAYRLCSPLHRLRGAQPSSVPPMLGGALLVLWSAMACR